MKEIYLDFDGVLCDSAFEAFRLCLYTNNEIKNILDDDKDEFYDEFLKYRPYVGPATDYFEVMNNIFNKYIFETKEEFVKNFFHNRIEFQKNNKEEWLKLNKMYDIFFEIKRSYKIITNKNKESLKELISRKTNKVSEIISMADYDYKKNKIDILNSANEGDILFIDDNYKEIINSKTNKNRKIDIYQANWGYCEKFSDVSVDKLKALEIINEF